MYFLLKAHRLLWLAIMESAYDKEDVMQDMFLCASTSTPKPRWFTRLQELGLDMEEPESDCFACEYAALIKEDNESHCVACPFVEFGKRCNADVSDYRKWLEDHSTENAATILAWKPKRYNYGRYSW